MILTSRCFASLSWATRRVLQSYKRHWGKSTPKASARENGFRLFQSLNLVVPRFLPHIEVVKCEVARFVKILTAIGQLQNVFDGAFFVGLVLRFLDLVLSDDLLV